MGLLPLFTRVPPSFTGDSKFVKPVMWMWFSASPVVLSMWPCKNISHIHYLLFSKPTHKSKTRTVNRSENTISKPLGPIIMIGQSETENCSHITFGTLFGQVLGFVVPFTRLSKLHKCWTKTILLSQTSIFWLFFIQFEFAGSHKPLVSVHA